MRIHERIHAARVSLHAGTVVVRGDLNILVCGRSHAQDSLLTIELDVCLAENLGEFTRSRTPNDVHLPQTVLSGHITLREEEVVEIGGFDGGNAVSVADGRHWSGDSGDTQFAVELGQGRTRHPVEPAGGRAD